MYALSMYVCVCLCVCVCVCLSMFSHVTHNVRLYLAVSDVSSTLNKLHKFRQSLR